MTTPAIERSWLTDAASAWQAFMFRPEPAYTLGLVRIGFGALIVLWTLSLLWDLDAFFTSSGVDPALIRQPLEWNVFGVWSSDGAVYVGWAALLVAALALTVGWHSRIAAVIVFVLVLSFQFRNDYVFNSGDNLIRIEALFLALAPSGAALSLDQRRATGSFWTAQSRAPWVLRLLQIQLSLIYVATFTTRMTGDAWTDGTAMSYALRLQDMLIIPLPEALTTDPLLMNLATWGTLLVELLIGILVWSSRFRKAALIAGVTLHTVILATVAVGFFTPAMLILYLAFIAPETAQRFAERVSSRRRSALD